jgi:hypothetical protein
MSLVFNISQESDNNYQVKMFHPLGVFHSELSILKGFSSENISEAHLQLQKILEFVPSTFDLSKIDFEKDFFNLFSFKERAYPSVLFALESLILQLLPKKMEEIKYQTNDLIFLEQEDSYREDISLSSVIKIKIGRNHSSVEIGMIQDLLAKHPEVKKIRFDANRNLELRDLDFYAISQLDYFESPLKNFNDYQHCPYPVGLDEDIELLNGNPPPSCIQALIFKPKVRLGISGMIKLINRYPNLSPILTHSYEGVWGRKILERLPLWIPVLNTGFQGLKFKD